MQNIILAVVDGMRFDRLSVHGYGKDTTPHFAQLAKRGRTFTNAYAASNYTIAAFATFYTGLHAAQHGMIHSHDLPPFTQVGCTPQHLACRMRQQGYHTIVIDRDIAHDWYTVSHYGFDDARDPRTRRGEQFSWAEDVADAALDAIRQCGDRPYFLVMHFYEARRPFFCPAIHKQRFPPDGNSQELDAAMNYWDTHFARVMEQAGVDARWIVTSDHGLYLGERGRGKGHLTLYENIIHIPLIMGPYDTTEVDHVATLVDHTYLYHTILDHAHPKNLWHTPEGLPFVVACEGHVQGKWAIHDGQWKMIKAVTNREVNCAPIQLYRLPDESTNYIDIYPDMRAYLEHALADWQRHMTGGVDLLRELVTFQQRFQVEGWMQQYHQHLDVFI